MRRTLIALVLAALALSAQTVDRTKPPQTPPIPNFKLPPVYETKLPNGLGIVLVEDARFPLVSVALNFQAGSKFDPKEILGLSEAVAQLVTEGTKGRTSRQISEEIDSIGGALNGAAGPDALTISGNSLSESLSTLLTLLSDVTLNANFPTDEVELYQQNRVQALRASRSEPSYLADEAMSDTIYGASPYAHIGPTEASIAKLDPKVLANFRDTYLVPNNATLLLIGKLPPRAELMKTLTADFGDWKQKPLAAAPKMQFPAPKKQIILVDRPGSVQADIHIGRLGPIRTSPEYFPLRVGNFVLGGGTNSRMFKNIREKEGFAYDAHSEYGTRRESGDIQAITQVRNEVIEPAMKAVLAELEGMGAKPVPADELTGIKNFLAGNYVLSMETQSGVIAQLSNMKTLGLPNEYLETYVTHVRSVEPPQLQAAAKKYIVPGESAIVVVGDAKVIGDALKKFGQVTVTKAK
jgi:zinc protease